MALRPMPRSAKSPYGYIDLWAREHYKSTIITYAASIQEILQTHGDSDISGIRGPDPGATGQGARDLLRLEARADLPQLRDDGQGLAEGSGAGGGGGREQDDSGGGDLGGSREVTIGIFSHNNSIARRFLEQIKRTLTDNQLLKDLFPDILYQRPDRESPMWSQSGFIVKRDGNPKEPTVGGHGLVDGMPTGAHYSLLVYDDVVSEKHVTTPEQIQKTTEAWELSRFLGTDGGRVKYIGTRYHYNDTYRTILQRNIVTPRIYPATLDGRLEGEPVFLSRNRWKELVQGGDTYILACQMMQDPKADSAAGFQREWLNYWDADKWSGMNVYLLCDPANSKNKKSDWTSINVIGLGADGNKYWIDGIRDRLNMKERSDAIFAFHRKYRPIGVGYEKYGHQTDIEYIQREQGLVNYRFEVTPLGGTMGKNDRIRRLVPDLAKGKWYWPKHIYKTLYDGTNCDVVEQTLLEEYDPFPVPIHDDTLDCMSRIYDEDLYARPPMLYPETEDRYTRAQRKSSRRSGWAR